MSENTKLDPVRPLHAIAREIRKLWIKKDGSSAIYFGAVPYLDALSTMTTVREDFGADPGPEIVRYFLANASTWKGDAARRIKEELKRHLKG